MNSNDSKIELTKLTQIPQIFLVNTSNFNHFIKDHFVFVNTSTNINSGDLVEWKIHKSFLAFNGWNSSLSDQNRITEYAFVEILGNDENDQIELKELSLFSLKFDQFMFLKSNSNVTNVLV